MTTTDPHITESRSLSIVWLIPFVALLIGGWMVYQDWRSQGTVITLSFATAEGIVKGKTVIKALNVDVGRVEDVTLSPNLDSVTVKARINQNAAHLLRTDSQFWVVKPRVDMKSISGLDTLVSGAYIELQPGKSSQTETRFSGHEQPPVTSANAKGVRLQLYSEQGSSLSIGSAVNYRGFDVGRIEQVEFDSTQKKMRYEIFIRAPFNELVFEGSRFWNTSGIDISSSSKGFSIRTGSLETLLSGGIAFDVPDGHEAGATATSGQTYPLFANFDAINDKDYQLYREYLLEFDQSVRGLEAGAPVEFRGIRIGTVQGISYALLPNNLADYDARIPVLIRIELARIGVVDLENSNTELQQWISQGMRASLKSGNLLTGALYVSLDIYPDEENASLIERSGYPVIPTVSGGFERLENKAFAVLNKLEQLPLTDLINITSDMMADGQQAVQQLNKTLASLDKLLASSDTHPLSKEAISTLEAIQTSARTLSPDSPLYHELTNSLQKLRAVLTKLEPVIETLNDKPSALIFDNPAQPDPIPGANR